MKMAPTVIGTTDGTSDGTTDNERQELSNRRVRETESESALSKEDCKLQKAMQAMERARKAAGYTRPVTLPVSVILEGTMMSVGGAVTKRKGAAAKTASAIGMAGGAACKNKVVGSEVSAFSTVAASLDEGKTTAVCKGTGSAASLVSRVSIGMAIASAALEGKVPAATSSNTGKKKGEVIVTSLPKGSTTEVKEKGGAAASSNIGREKGDGVATPVSKGLTSLRP